jgi:tripartite ATP-independent transporter DctM subunit
MTELLVVLIVVAALFGLPLFVVMFFLAAVLYPTADRPMDLKNAFVQMADLMEKPYLLPIPLFTLAGFLLAESQAPKRLVKLADALLGWLPGGLAIVTILTLTFFTTFTGASGVTIIALGGMLWPLLLKRGYPERLSLGTITASGSMGLLFFPSLPVFLYVTVVSISSETSMTPTQLFLAGAFPGLLMVSLFVIFALINGVRLKIPTRHHRVLDVLKEHPAVLLEAFLPVLLFGLVMSGTIGLNDIAVVTVSYVLVVECLISFTSKDWRYLRSLPKIIGDAMGLVGAIVVILAVILGLNNYLIDEEIPQAILAAIETQIDSKWMMLLALNLFLLVVGCVMDIFSALIAVLPLLLPLADRFDVHPLHLGVIFLANLEVGYLTPPVGMNLFISSLHFKKSVFETTRAVLPFLGLLLVALGIITYVEPLTLWLPAQVDPATAQMGKKATEELLPSVDGELDLEKLLEPPPGEEAPGGPGGPGSVPAGAPAGGGTDEIDWDNPTGPTGPSGPTGPTGKPPAAAPDARAKPDAGAPAKPSEGEIDWDNVDKL